MGFFKKVFGDASPGEGAPQATTEPERLAEAAPGYSEAVAPEPPPQPQVQAASWYCKYKLRFSCTECGAPVNVNGPLRSVDCTACLFTHALDDDFWASALKSALRDYFEKDWDQTSTVFSFSDLAPVMTHGRGLPRCAMCQEALPLDVVPFGSTGRIYCPRCAAVNPCFPAPEWVRAIYPSALQVYCADGMPEGEGADAILSLSTPESARPVAISCLGCGASLRVTSETPRILNCEFCDTDSYLPDTLWLRLHPASKRRFWYVIFHGPAPT